MAGREVPLENYPIYASVRQIILNNLLINLLLIFARSYYVKLKLMTQIRKCPVLN